jgi:predicted nucleic acid-binding protein
MGARTDAYVDSSAFVAFMDRSDTHHLLFRRLFSAPPTLVTTTLVVAEAHAWFLRRYDSARALQFLSMIESMTPLQVTAVGADEQAAAARLLRRFADQSLTMTDAVGLHVMADAGCSVCWSTDRHLGITGVPLAINDR